MTYNNKYQDGQKVMIKETREVVTINRWGYVKKMNRYTYTIMEHPGTFYFENELEGETP